LFTGEDSWDGIGETPDVLADINPWSSANDQPTHPTLSVESRSAYAPQRNVILSSSSSRRSTPVSSPLLPESNDWDSSGGWDPVEKKASTTKAGISREEKAAEMARRKAERKQVCAFSTPIPVSP